MIKETHPTMNEDKQCGYHTQSMERIARLEAIADGHNVSIARQQEIAAQQTETMGNINKCMAKLSKQMDAFEDRWDRRSKETDLIIAEYHQTIIAINKRFEEGDNRFDMLESINENFSWFVKSANNIRDRVAKMIMWAVVLAALLFATTRFTDVREVIFKTIK